MRAVIESMRSGVSQVLILLHIRFRIGSIRKRRISITEPIQDGPEPASKEPCGRAIME
jgi:hypothetical protein